MLFLRQPCLKILFKIIIQKKKEKKGKKQSKKTYFALFKFLHIEDCQHKINYTWTVPSFAKL